MSFVKMYISHYERHEIEDLAGCDCEFTGENYLLKIKHSRTVHQDYLGCSVEKCPSTFITVKALQEHLKIHMETNDKCDKCDYSTPFPRYLRKHIEKVHLNTKANPSDKFTCEECGEEFQFKNKQKYWNHVSRIHRSKVCNLCGITVTSKKYSDHMKRAHLTEQDRKFRCEQCGKGFIEKFRMGVHIESVHMGVKYKCRYSECETSDQTYCNSSNRSAHERKRHGRVFSKSNSS